MDAYAAKLAEFDAWNERYQRWRLECRRHLHVVIGWGEEDALAARIDEDGTVVLDTPGDTPVILWRFLEPWSRSPHNPAKEA